jgi:YebC/PmpR family DNA-binding regulatory protein
MSGHSKWSQIKHRKAITDKKKAQTFGKVAKAISIAARENPDPKMNLKLKTLIDQAKSINMPNDNIERLLKRAKDKSDAALEELQIEAIGPGNTSIIITAITDSRNRTMNEVKIILTKNDGKLAGEGALSWMFTKERAEDGSWVFTPTFTSPISESDQEDLNKLFEALDDNDDVQDIFSNNE